MSFAWHRDMKKVLIYTAVVLLILIGVGTLVVNRAIVHIRLPHGAVLHVLPARENNQTRGAVILCPGGGYNHLARWNEGYLWFPFFYRQGFAVAMLEYRMPNQDPQTPVIDGTEAIRLMRNRAEEWHYDAGNVGMMGFSAGGHLASTLMVSKKAAVRPDFGILFYPVVSMKKELTHQRSHDCLLGQDASEQLETRYSSELHVSEQTPPAYLAVSRDDPKVKPENAIRFHDAMQAKNRPVSLHVYPSGGHGWGCLPTFDHYSRMLDDLAGWLNDRQHESLNERKP